MDDDVCAICWEVPSNPFTLPCKHSFCYMCLKSVAEQHKPCPNCNALIPDFVFEKAKVSDDIIDLDKDAGNWVYSARTDGWWFFAREQDEIIEEMWVVYQKTKQPRSFDLDILQRRYKMDFENMTQISSGTTRKIKRIEKSDRESHFIKGIAGIQVVKKEEMPEMPQPEWPDPNQYVFNPGAWQDDEEEDEIEEEEEDEDDIDVQEAAELTSSSVWESAYNDEDEVDLEMLAEEQADP